MFHARNCMKHSPSEANNSLASEELPLLWRKSKASSQDAVTDTCRQSDEFSHILIEMGVRFMLIYKLDKNNFRPIYFLPLSSETIFFFGINS